MKIRWQGIVFVGINFLAFFGIRALFGFEVAVLWGLAAATVDIKYRQ
jgi:hypothetical protein